MGRVLHGSSELRMSSTRTANMRLLSLSARLSAFRHQREPSQAPRQKTIAGMEAAPEP